MIQPNELRIGNLIYLDETLIEVDVHVLIDILMGVDGFSPIPITPELLERARLKRDREGWIISYSYKIYDPLVIGGTGSYVNANRKTYCILHDDKIMPKGFQYLHQLQNLYFALTGEELNIEL